MKRALVLVSLAACATPVLPGDADVRLAAGKGRLIRHHDVSAQVLEEGRVVFMQRDANDTLIRTVTLEAPPAHGGMPWQAVYYDKAWNLDDAAPRDALLKAVWAPHGRYVDPAADLTSPENVSQMIGNFRRVFIGAQVSATSGVGDSGDGWLTFDWVITSRLGGRVLYEGFDVVHLNADGQVELLAGFFGKRSP